MIAAMDNRLGFLLTFGRVKLALILGQDDNIVAMPMYRMGNYSTSLVSTLESVGSYRNG